MEERVYKQLVTATMLVILLILSFILLKPILLSMIVGMILAFIFTPVYKKLNQVVKQKTLSTSLICGLLILLILIPLWFLAPIIVEQSLKIYLAAQQVDFVSALQNMFPTIFSSPEFSQEVGNALHVFVSKITNVLAEGFSDILINSPTIMMQSLVVFFTFFFTLRDGEELLAYIRSLLPFSKDIEKQLFNKTKGITSSVIYGQIIIGVIQGLLMAIGFFIFRVPNATLLSVLAVLAGVLPIIGTALVWIPVAIYLMVAGNGFEAVGVIIFGIISSNIDNFLRPIIVSKRTHISSSLVLVGMIGGLFSFGILGLILGPLILAYLLIFLEVYRKNKSPGFLLQEKN